MRCLLPGQTVVPQGVVSSSAKSSSASRNVKAPERVHDRSRSARRSAGEKGQISISGGAPTATNWLMHPTKPGTAPKAALRVKGAQVQPCQLDSGSPQVRTVSGGFGVALEHILGRYEPDHQAAMRPARTSPLVVLVPHVPVGCWARVPQLSRRLVT